MKTIIFNFYLLSFGEIPLRRKVALPKDLFVKFLESTESTEIDELLQQTECPSICLERGTHIDSLLV